MTHFSFYISFERTILNLWYSSVIYHHIYKQTTPE
ncbi:unnamed protein product [Coffea canephora]|uniref:DH200=94 genomic scaffold, scaffold_1414 n=1 Tax=Coffea canephora TaxID=49390 RepID=A0A068VLP6_COFCA|nr:unnamed protein product [Coffea canephora]